MYRMTTDNPKSNFETILNFVFGKDGWAYIRQSGDLENVPLTQWAKSQCLLRGCDEFPGDSPEKIDEELVGCMTDYSDCPIALAYCFASQAVHLRSRLKMYEDVLFREDGTERMTVEQLKDFLEYNDRKREEAGNEA